VIVIRILGVLTLITIGASVLAWVITRNRRWLRFATQVLKLAVVTGIVLVLLYVLERTL
jgi:hypothetical protein